MVSQPTTGGTARHVIDLSQGLAARDWRVAVACPASGWLAARIQSPNVKVVRLEMVRDISMISDARAFLRLWRLCKTVRPDVLHLHSSKAGFLGRVAGRLAGVPVVCFTPHCWSFQSVIGRQRRFYAALERFASRFCDMTIAVSRHEAREALNLGVVREDRIVVIPNGVPPFPGGDLPERIAERLAGKGTLIASVGRLDEQKGYTYMIEAMAHVAAAHQDAQLVVAGDGPLADQLQTQAAQQDIDGAMRFLGEIDQVNGLLAHADLFVLSSLWEGLPYTILEAMAAGLAVVATDVGGCAELVVDGETGTIVPPADPDKLAEALLALLEDSDLRARMGAAAKKRAAEHFSLEALVDANASLYERLIAQKGRSDRV